MESLMATTSACPAAQHLEQLVKSQLPPAQKEEVMRHLLDCQRCAELVRLLAGAGEPDPTEVLSSVEGRAALLTRLRRNLAGPAAPAPSPGISPDDSSEWATRQHVTLITEGSVPPVVLTGEELPPVLTPPQRPDEIGRLGPYRVLTRLGSGGMGIVFGAEDPALGRPVALKVLLPSLAANADSAERFLREARIMAKLKHENVVTVYQVGKDRNIPYLAMELLEGESLDQRVRRERMLPLPEVIRIGREAAEGLAAAHRRGLIHRDIKPANLWLEAETGRIKVLDFGLARGTDSGPGLTQQGIVMGTPAYMAPEQARGEKVGPAADLFALGCVLYELCTGQMLFHRNDTMSTLMAVVNDHPAPPCNFRPDVSPALSSLIMRMLSKSPAQRPETAVAVVEALKQIGDPSVVAAQRAPATAAPSELPRVETPRRKRIGAILFLLLLLVGAGFGLFYSSEIALFLANKGEVEVPAAETDEVTVLVKDGEGNKVDEQTKAVVRLPAGSYVLEVTVRNPATNDMRFLTRDVTVKRGTKEYLSLAQVPSVRRTNVLDHPGEVYALAISEDGKYLASGNRDGSVKVWDLASGKEQCSIGRSAEDDGDAINALAFHPEGKRLASGDMHGGVREWNPATGEALRTLSGPTSRVTAVTYSPDGKLLAAGGWDRTIYLWDVASGEKAPSVSSPVDKVGALVFNPENNRLLAVGGYDGTVAVVNVAGNPVFAHKSHAHNVLAVTFAPDGHQVVSTGWDKLVQFWDAGTGEPGKSLHGATHSLSFDAKGRWLAGGEYNQAIRVWDVASGDQLLMMPRAGHKVAFSPKGTTLVTGGTSGHLFVWDLASLARR
jgi:WD40 repeat protein